MVHQFCFFLFQSSFARAHSILISMARVNLLCAFVVGIGCRYGEDLTDMLRALYAVLCCCAFCCESVISSA